MSDTYRNANGGPKKSTLTDIGDEVVAARMAFPTNEHRLAAITEEVGELAQALLQKQPWDRVYDEAMQVACTAIRLMEEGDSDFGRLPE